MNDTIDTLETIEVTPTARIRVVADISPECPRGDWYMVTGYVNIDSAGERGYKDVPAVHDDPIEIERADYNIVRNAGHNPEVVERWARIFHGLHVEYDSKYGGYWFADPDEMAANWPDLKLGTPDHLAKQAEVIKGEREIYRQWADGEVYGVIFERAKTMAPVQWNAADEVWELINGLTDDDLLTEWDEEDATWESYLSDEYPAAMAVLEYATLTPEEDAAVLALLPEDDRNRVVAHRTAQAAA